ncbi:MAG: hypothetical protein IE909_02705 [Campylobacterales bacterium]|nr:hypothetical protein [Campylobacterales bacterium]
MQKESILYLLDSHGVSEEHLAIFSDKLKNKSFTTADCDKLLVKLGYDKLFVVDDFEDDDDMDFDTYEKNKPKHTLVD